MRRSIIARIRGILAATIRTVTLTVDGARWLTGPQDFESGVAGSTHRSTLLLVGDDYYVHWTAAADTPAGVVQTGYDPGDFPTEFPECVGRTGYTVELPQGNVTPEDHADLVAAVVETIPGVYSAIPAASQNVNGTWDIAIRTNLDVAPGARDFDSRGAAGAHGGHAWRPSLAGDDLTTTSIDITRPVGTPITNVPANALPWGIQILLGGTVSTASSARPRIQIRLDGTVDTSPAGSAIVFDAGQVPTSEIVANTPATIFFTPAQTLACYTAVHGVGAGRLWLTVKAAGGTHYTGPPNTVAQYAGQQVTTNVRVETVGSNDPTVAGPTTWSAAGELNFAFWLNARILYEVDPATNGEHVANWGSFTASSAHPSDVTLPDSKTQQTGPFAQHVGAIVRDMSLHVVSGVVRLGLMQGGDTTPAVSSIGATPLWDAGQTSTTGLITVVAPTGAGTIRVPASGLWLFFYGFNAVGRGEVGPSPHTQASPRFPATWVEHGGANNGRTVRETDVAGAGLGNAAVAPNTVAGAETFPDNNPFGQVSMYQPPLAVAA